MLQSKIYIEGKIKTVTGLHIGGSKSSLDIGGVDNNIIKTSQGLPYIPGSSLKGKLRNMLARVAGSENVEQDIVKTGKLNHIAEMFGIPAEMNKKQQAGRTEALLKVYDSFLDSPKDVEKRKLELTYSEVKMENSIDRITSNANPRPLERVPEDVFFKFNMILDVYDKKQTESMLKELCLAMQLLEFDHLGGSGSRGSGRVKFSEISCKELSINSELFELEEVKCIHTEIFNKLNTSESSNT